MLKHSVVYLTEFEIVLLFIACSFMGWLCAEFWTRILILAPPHAMSLGVGRTSLNHSCVVGKVSDRQCAPFQFWYSVVLAQLTFPLQTSGKPELCSQSESWYTWIHLCLVNTVWGGCLQIQPVPWQLIKQKKRLMEQWIWRFHYCHNWHESLVGQCHELSTHKESNVHVIRYCHCSQIGDTVLKWISNLLLLRPDDLHVEASQWFKEE